MPSKTKNIEALAKRTLKEGPKYILEEIQRQLEKLEKYSSGPNELFVQIKAYQRETNSIKKKYGFEFPDLQRKYEKLYSKTKSSFPEKDF